MDLETYNQLIEEFKEYPGYGVHTGVDKVSEKLGQPYDATRAISCLLYTSPSPRDKRQSRMPSSA